MQLSSGTSYSIRPSNNLFPSAHGQTILHNCGVIYSWCKWSLLGPVFKLWKKKTVNCILWYLSMRTFCRQELIRFATSGQLSLLTYSKKGNKNKMFSDCIMRKQTSIDTSCLLSECKATGNSYDIANILYYKEGSTNYKYSII